MSNRPSGAAIVNRLDRCPSLTEVNGTFGYRFPATVGPGVNYVELYARGYHGPNPYGQLRNQATFSLISLGAKVIH